MEYSIARLARLSGVSTRTLRYYDQIDLLRPARVSNGYRVYGQKEVDLLQQILFFRELGVELKEIAVILQSPRFNREKALESHLAALRQKKERLDNLIANVTKTISAMKGEAIMSDREKFDGFKEKMISDNEELYGKEIRQRYGDDSVNASNNRIRNMEEDKMRESEELRERLEKALKEAYAGGDPASELSQSVCEMHKRWVCIFWPDGAYTKEAHKLLADMYVEDERFRANYEKIAPGCAEFLREAIYIYCAV